MYVLFESYNFLKSFLSSFALFALHLTEEMLFNNIFAVIGDCNVLDFVDDFFKCDQFNERKGIGFS